jgi:hypothetical protein
MHHPAHQAAFRRQLAGELAAIATTSAWIPHHINALESRCTACGRMADVAQNSGSYRCGERLPQAQW